MLLGQEAEALAPRLEASGYRCLLGREQLRAGCDLAVLGAEAADQVPLLQQQLAGVPLLGGRVARSIRERVPDAVLVGGQLGMPRELQLSVTRNWLRRLRGLSHQTRRLLIR